jgi:hypothetical protein
VAEVEGEGEDTDVLAQVGPWSGVAGRTPGMEIMQVGGERRLTVRTDGSDASIGLAGRAVANRQRWIGERPPVTPACPRHYVRHQCQHQRYRDGRRHHS